VACRAGHVETARLLIERFGADPREPAVSGRTAIYRACLGRGEESATEIRKAIGVIDLLVQVGGVGVNEPCSVMDGALPLTCAVRNPHRLAVVRHLVETHGARVNVADRAGITPLMTAILSPAGSVSAETRMQSMAIVKFLCTVGGADVHAREKGGDVALVMAASVGRDDAVRYLIRRGARAFAAVAAAAAASGESPPEAAGGTIARTDDDTAADGNGGNDNEDHAAAAMLDPAQLRAAAFVEGAYGDTALAIAARRGHLTVIEHIISLFRDGGGHAQTATGVAAPTAPIPPASRPRQRQALHYAAEAGQERVVAYLLRHRVGDPAARDAKGDAPYDLAVEHGWDKVAAMIAKETGGGTATGKKGASLPRLKRDDEHHHNQIHHPDAAKFDPDSKPEATGIKKWFACCIPKPKPKSSHAAVHQAGY
jgi:ankyrin repeat protein